MSSNDDITNGSIRVRLDPRSAALDGMLEFAAAIASRLDATLNECTLVVAADCVTIARFEPKNLDWWERARDFCVVHGILGSLVGEPVCTCLRSDDERKLLYTCLYDIKRRAEHIGATDTVTAAGLNVYVPMRIARDLHAFTQELYAGVTIKAAEAAGMIPIAERNVAAYMNMTAGSMLERYALSMLVDRLGATLQSSSTDGPATRTSSGALQAPSHIERPIVLAPAGFAALVYGALAPLIDDTPRLPLVTSPDALIYFPPDTTAFAPGDLVVPLTGGPCLAPAQLDQRTRLVCTGVVEIKCRRRPVGLPSLAQAARLRATTSATAPVARPPSAAEIRAVENDYDTRTAMQVFGQMLATAIALGLIGDAHARTLESGAPHVVAMLSILFYLGWEAPPGMAAPLRPTADAERPRLIGIRTFLAPGSKQLVELFMDAIRGYVDYILTIRATCPRGSTVHALASMPDDYKRTISRLNDPSDPAWKEVLAVAMWPDVELTQGDVRAALETL